MFPSLPQRRPPADGLRARLEGPLDAAGNPLDGSGFLAPVVLAEKCVGCGLCQTRCHSINVKEKRLLEAVAIVVEAGSGREDRMAKGSYLELRAKERAAAQSAPEADAGSYLPEFLK